jgi:hypothetical protein
MAEDRILSRFSFFTKILDSNRFFVTFLAVFILIQTVVLYQRDGKDLKVGLYGAAQVFQRKSPYENPLDPNRPIFRYAPGIAILQYPFLLKSKVVGPYEFENIHPSVFAWYLAELLALLGSAFLLFKLIPACSRETSLWNLKLSILMALPFITYELSNSQNKLIALFFMVAAIFLFEKKKLFWAAFSFNIALTIYIALFPFLLYFVIRNKKFIISFLIATFLVFLLIPSLILGVQFNVYLLKEWFTRTLQPFFLTNSYATYIDLRRSSQAMPSAIGRIFVLKDAAHFHYLISPPIIHILIRIISASIVLCSCLAIWRKPKDTMRGLVYTAFLILALILPQYCIYYTWAYLFVFYFASFNYISHPDVLASRKKFFRTLVSILFISSCLMAITPLKYFSFLFWGTFLLWVGIVIVLIKESGIRFTAKSLFAFRKNVDA